MVFNRVTVYLNCCLIHDALISPSLISHLAISSGLLPGPRTHYCAWPRSFGSLGPSEEISRPFASDKSPKRIDREGLGKRRTGTLAKSALGFMR